MAKNTNKSKPLPIYIINGPNLNVTLNGETRALDAGLTVTSMLVSLGLDPVKIAVERNLQIVPRSTYAGVALESGDRLEIVGIAVDFRAAVADYVRRRAVDYPLLIGEDQGLAAAEQFGMQTVLPFSVFADAQGRIIAVKIGELHRDEADYILGAMRELAAGRLSLPEAHAGIAQRLRELAVERARAGADNS